MTVRFILLILLIGIIPLQGQECTHQPPPFEKIYVRPHDIFTNYEGIFYVSPSGEMEKVRALRTDCDGTYIITFLRQCPICEKFYCGDKCDEGYDCPLIKEELTPQIWWRK